MTAGWKTGLGGIDVDWILIPNLGFLWEDGGISIADIEETTSFGSGGKNESDCCGVMDKGKVFWAHVTSNNGDFFLMKVKSLFILLIFLAGLMFLLFGIVAWQEMVTERRLPQLSRSSKLDLGRDYTGWRLFLDLLCGELEDQKEIAQLSRSSKLDLGRDYTWWRLFMDLLCGELEDPK